MTIGAPTYRSSEGGSIGHSVMTPYHRELSAACVAARIAGNVVMSYYGSVTHERKRGGSPVTAADRASSDAILSELNRAFPGDAILCEESQDAPSRLGAERVWIVDPLDGTKEFLAQNGEFAVMIGLAVNGEPVIGVVFLPASNTLYCAETGCGAWVEFDGTRRELKCAPASDRLRVVTSRSHANPVVEQICDALPITERWHSGSVGIKCALIAEGQCDIYAHPVAFMGEWDTCAPEVILREAGGVVSDCLGAPLQYNKVRPMQRLGILACSPAYLAQFSSAVADAFRASHSE